MNRSDIIVLLFTARPSWSLISINRYKRVTLKRSALLMTLTEDSAMAAAAIIGDSNNPNAG